MHPNLRNALLIHNPNAGYGGSGRRRKLDEARRILSLGGIEADLQETRAPGEATAMAHRASVEGRQLVIACGGDGTLNEIVNGLAAQQNGHRVPLALLPGGTANILAKELGLPWDIPSAAEKLVHGAVKEIALGLATPLEQPEKKRSFLSVAGDKKLDASLVIVGRTQHYGGPFMITTGAGLFEDQFEAMALTTQSGLRYLSYLPTLWMGKLRGTDGVHFWKADSLVCEPLDKNPLYAQIDGERLARLPVEFKIIPRALKLLVPGAHA